MGETIKYEKGKPIPARVLQEWDRQFEEVDGYRDLPNAWIIRALLDEVARLNGWRKAKP